MNIAKENEETDANDTQNAGTWTVGIYVAESDLEVARGVSEENGAHDENAVRRDSKPLRLSPAGKVVEVPLSALQESWAQTADMLAVLGDSVDEKSPTWGIDSIEVGLTLGAEGQLFWIAKASAQASVKFTLKRR